MSIPSKILVPATGGIYDIAPNMNKNIYLWISKFGSCECQNLRRTFLVESSSINPPKQDSLDQCPMSINADQNHGIDPKRLSMPVIADQCRLIPINSIIRALVGIDRHWYRCQNFDRHWSALSIDRGESCPKTLTSWSTFITPGSKSIKLEDQWKRNSNLKRWQMFPATHQQIQSLSSSPKCLLIEKSRLIPEVCSRQIYRQSKIWNLLLPPQNQMGPEHLLISLAR